MKPIKFKEAHLTFAEGQPQYGNLPAFRSKDGIVVTCWKMGFWERLRAFWSGRIYISIMTFHKPLQPLQVDADKWQIFEKREEIAQIKDTPFGE